MTDPRLRLTLLGGFLGAGKTTWLRHHLHAGSFGRVHVVVNEAADAPVDDALLSAAQKLTLLAGACVCCTGRDTLRSALRQICDTRSATADAAARIDSIVLETSGLADPGAILALIQSDPLLVRQIVVTETVVIVDAPNALAQLKDEALSRRQIAAADRLILTKTDGTSLAPLRATLRALAPGATQSGAAFGVGFALPDLDPAAPPVPLSDTEDTPLTATRLDLGDTPDWTGFSVWLSALLYARGDRIVRVKGVIRTPAGRLLLQAVRHRVQSPEILPDTASDSGAPTDNSIAVIGRGFTQEQLETSFKRYSA